MVLENSTSASPPYRDTAPASDIDPYASSSSPLTTPETTHLAVTPPPDAIYVNLETLPHRWSLLTQKQHPQLLLTGIREQCAFASQLLSRPVTQDEADAIAFHFAKSLRIGSYGSPAGAVLGTLFAVRGQASYRFPFWTPMKAGGRFRPDVFGPLRGAMARSAWNAARLSAYWVVGAGLCQVFMGSYALTVAMTGRALDPRLKEFGDALKVRMKERSSAAGRQPDETPAARGGETFDMARQRRGAQEIGRRGSFGGGGSAGANRVDDDASPTGGMFGSEYSMEAPAMQTDEQVRQQDVVRERAATVAAQQVTRAQHASPAAAREEPKQNSASAWGRLRQSAMSGQSPQAARGQQTSRSNEGGNRDDVFDFSSQDSSSERESKVARAEAQRQFDRSIEREREGRDFEDEPKSKGWRR